MSFLESPRFPTGLARGAVGGPAFMTDVIELVSGYEQRNEVWSAPRQRYSISFVNRTQTEIDALNAYIRATHGRLYGFRFRDQVDYLVTTSNGRLGTTAIGTGLATYQLYKRYTSSPNTSDRLIMKPVSGAVAVFRAASPVTVGASAGNIAIDTTTGIITFVADQTKSISSHTVGATHIFTLASAFSPNLAIGGKIYVSGITGTAATTLNGLAHTVTNVSSAIITTSTVTTGLTASGGTASFFPQPTEALTWSGSFDVPVRFDTDRMVAEARHVTSGGSFTWDRIELVEVRGE